METFELQAGTVLPLEVQLQDSLGNPPTYYSPATPLSAVVWPGGNRKALFNVDACWLDAANGIVTLIHSAQSTLLLPQGTYRGELTSFDPLRGPEIIYQWRIDLTAAPGQATEPSSYCAYSDLADYAQGWIGKLVDDDSEESFAKSRGRARSWLDDLILKACPNQWGDWNVQGTAGYSPFAGLFFGGVDTPNIYLRSLLDQNLLFVRDWVIEATAKKTLSLICEGQIGFGDDAKQYALMGRKYAAESLAIARSNSAEIGYPVVATTAGGSTVAVASNVVFGESYPMFAINLGSVSFR